jgi:hypothetical protein
MTDMGIYSLKRLIQEGTDSAHAFQNGMMEVFTDLVYEIILIWIYDILVLDKTFEAYLDTLMQVFKRLLDQNVKLNPKKTDVCLREITWCGRRISEQGVTFDPAMIDGLTNLEEPTNAGQLQKFLCGANWIIPCLPHYAREVSLLHELLSSIQEYIGSLKPSQLK